MNWLQLLNTTRVKELYGQGTSIKSPSDFRGEFERDYGRTVFSTPVRRLQDKAQVFPLVTDDFVRTRLTHSIEVSSVARGLGGQIGRWLLEKGDLTPDTRPCLETIAATCGMLHDLGNPPFGHAGEQAINEWCRDVGRVGDVFSAKPQLAQDFIGWNGNAQTIRLVGKLQVLADEYGLNLTCGTMSATSKYIAASDKVRSEAVDTSKVGYFFSESDLVHKVREATGTGEARHPIALVVEASDDIVYACVDLEDGIKKRLITWRELESQVLEESDGSAHTEKALELAKQKIGSALSGFSLDEGLVQAFRTYAIVEATRAAFEEFKRGYLEIMAGTYHDSLIKRSTAAPLIKACKRIARRVCYESDEVFKTEIMGRRIIHDLLSIFWEGVSKGSIDGESEPFAKKAFELMSSNYRQVYRNAISRIDEADPHAGSLITYSQLQFVCDYISGMTDSFATNLHKKLTNG
jgi:dGTPase